MIVRLYRRAGSLEVETRAMEAVQGVVPVPRILHVDGAGVVMEYVDGITFRQLRRSGDGAAVAEAAYAIGRTLAELRYARLDAPRVETRVDWTAPLLRERLSATECEQVARILEQVDWTQLDAADHLAHGDFNNRNVLVHNAGGRWKVAAIVDWEAVRRGSPLFDVARFLQYEREDNSSREPHFSRGFADGGGHLPDDWRGLVAAINLVQQCQLLGEPDVPDDVIAEVRGLIRGRLLRPLRP